MASADDDAWYADEPRWGTSFVTELRRLQRRAATRPILTMTIAIAMTGLVVMRVARKPHVAIAHVVIAVTEGNLASGRDPIPVSQMQDYANNRLLPNDKLTALIEELNLFPARKRLGMPFAIAELRDMIEVTAYRNYFADEQYEPSLRRTARLEISAEAADPGLSYDVAEHIAQIIVDTSDEIQDDAAADMNRQIDQILGRASAQMSEVDRTISERELALQDAEHKGDAGLAAGLRAELAGLDREERDARHKLAVLQASIVDERFDANAMAAGLDLKLEIVSERRAPAEGGQGLRLAILAIIAFIICLPVSFVVIGAFDARIHDADDVTRLGFASLGHVPGYGGDRIGSLRARGIRRRRAAQF